MPQRIAIAVAMAGALCGVPDGAEARQEVRNQRFERAPVRWISPLPAAEWEAGASYVLAWEGLPELDRHGHFEEWEAFLSLDDGAHYSVRLTPHLDLDLRRVAITLPDLVAERASLLLRFGDEESEFEYELPGRWPIRTARHSIRSSPTWALGVGEIARPGGASAGGVARWTEGTRRGDFAVERLAVAGGSGWEASVEPLGLTWRVATAPKDAPQPAQAPLAAHPVAAAADRARPRRGPIPRAAAIAPHRLTCRQNE